jgi:8-oxo-dGTP diphosphatase
VVSDDVAVQVACVFLVDRRGRVLLQLRDEHAPAYPDRWQMVGGLIEAGEEPEAAARRELKEETGLEVAGSLRFLFRDVTERPPPLPGRAEWFLFGAETDARQEDVACHEGREMSFKTLAEIRSLDLTPPAARFLSRFLESAV